MISFFKENLQTKGQGKLKVLKRDETYLLSFKHFTRIFWNAFITIDLSHHLSDLLRTAFIIN